MVRLRHNVHLTQMALTLGSRNVKDIESKFMCFAGVKPFIYYVYLIRIC